VFIDASMKHIAVGVGRGKLWRGCFAYSTCAYSRNNRRVVRRKLKNGLNLYVICRYTLSYEEVQQVGQLNEVRRPIVRSASVEIVTVVAGCH